MHNNQKFIPKQILAELQSSKRIQSAPPAPKKKKDQLQRKDDQTGRSAERKITAILELCPQ